LFPRYFGIKNKTLIYPKGSDKNRNICLSADRQAAVVVKRFVFVDSGDEVLYVEVDFWGR